MASNVNESLSAIHLSFINENNELKGKLKRNQSRIRELNDYIDGLNSEEDNDEKFFSPHKLGKEQIRNLKEDEMIHERAALQAENEGFLSEIEIIEERIKIIKEVISVDPFLNRFMLLDMQEKERQRIARDLHDSSLQNLIHLIHTIELCTLFIDRDTQRAKLELATIAQNIRMVINEIRETIYDLRPMEFDDLGFREAVQNMIEKMQKETDIFIKLDMSQNIVISNNLIFSNIYRIIRECMSNAIRHSAAREICISLFVNDGVFYVEVEDDGIGIEGNNKSANHFGLRILEERVQLLKGTLKIISSGRTGTTVNISIPIDM